MTTDSFMQAAIEEAQKSLAESGTPRDYRRAPSIQLWNEDIGE